MVRGKWKLSRSFLLQSRYEVKVNIKVSALERGIKWLLMLGKVSYIYPVFWKTVLLFIHSSTYLLPASFVCVGTVKKHGPTPKHLTLILNI